MKICAKCGNSKTKGKKVWRCRPCDNKYNTQYRKLKPEIVKKHRDNWNNNPEYKDYRRNAKLFRKFKITLDDYNKMFEEQNGLCKLCFKPETAKHRCGDKVQVKELSVDHNHTTGKN